MSDNTVAGDKLLLFEEALEYLGFESRAPGDEGACISWPKIKGYQMRETEKALEAVTDNHNFTRAHLYKFPGEREFVVLAECSVGHTLVPIKNAYWLGDRWRFKEYNIFDLKQTTVYRLAKLVKDNLERGRTVPFTKMRWFIFGAFALWFTASVGGSWRPNQWWWTSAALGVGVILFPLMTHAWWRIKLIGALKREKLSEDPPKVLDPRIMTPEALKAVQRQKPGRVIVARIKKQTEETLRSITQKKAGEETTLIAAE